MNKKNGYSLIELLGVLVIIGLILIIVIPATSKLLISNEKKEYDNYLKVVKAGASSYADYLKDDLGGSSDVGCTEVDLSYLIEQNHIKKFDDDKIQCTGKARINNDKGNINTYINLTCNHLNGEETFKVENIDTTKVCNPFVPRDDDILRLKIISNNSSNIYKPTADSDTYIKGENPNNYLWYSGKMWRIVSYNNSYVKLVTDDVITVIPRNNNASIEYENSILDKWLTNTFYDSLKDPEKYLYNASWDISSTSNPGDIPNKSNVIKRKVALLNSYDVLNMDSYLNGSYAWILSNYQSGSSYIRTATSGGNVNKEIWEMNNYYSIRPSITIKSDIYVVSGNGSYDSPYILEGNSTIISSGTLINTRYSGEYLTLGGSLYRIVKVSGNDTKVIMIDSVNNSYYDDNYYKYSTSNVYEYLNNEWYNGLSYKNLIKTNGSWCDEKVTLLGVYTDACDEDYTTAKVGIPYLGDLFTANTDGKNINFWTMNPYSIDDSDNYSLNIISGNNRGISSIGDSNAIRPIIYLKNDVIITSGKGTKDIPFVLGVK